MKIHFLVLFFSFLILNSCKQVTQKTIIAFGSCSHENDSIQMWNNVAEHQPRAWIWMGDNIYGDSYDMDVLKSKYDQQKLRPSYQRLLHETTIYGIWDDHDFGVNDGGKEYPMKVESKKLMLQFLDIPDSDEVWNREGAYQSHLIEDNGIKIKLILLDARYFRDSVINNPDAPPRYLPNHQGTVLGEQQWSWLEDQLTNSSADINLIGSSIQLIPNEQGYEKWGNFPNERQRFFDLIAKTSPSRPIILSGDRHIAEFSKIELEGLDYPLYEFTSSGLTHTWSRDEPEANKLRIGDMIIRKNFGLIKIEKSREKMNISLEVRGPENELLEETELQF